MDPAEKFIEIVTERAFDRLLEKLKERRKKKECFALLDQEVNRFFNDYACKYIESKSFEKFVLLNRYKIACDVRLVSVIEHQKKEALKDYIFLAKTIAVWNNEVFNSTEEQCVSAYCKLVASVSERFCSLARDRENLTVSDELLKRIDAYAKDAFIQNQELIDFCNEINNNQINFKYIIKSIPPVVRNTKPLHYTSNVIKNIVGREKELSQLKKFMDQRCNVSVWGIQGPGGVGKNKLVYEFIKTYTDDEMWSFRIVDYRKVALFNLCNDWNYDKNLCLVIDYSEFVKEQICEWLSKLSIKKRRGKKLRIILLSRVTDGFEHELEACGNVYYKNHKFLNVSMLSMEECIDLANQYSNYFKKRPLTEEERKRISASIKANLNAADYRPLFILLITIVSLSRRHSSSVMNWIEICDYVYEKDNKELKTLIPDNDIRLSLNNLIMFSTVFGKTLMDKQHSFIGSDASNVLDYLLKNDKDFFELSIEMTGRYTDNDGKYMLYPKTPDIIGEYFVLKRMRNNAFPLGEWSDYIVKNLDESKSFWFRTINDFAPNADFDVLFCRLFKSILKNEYLENAYVDIYPLILYYLDLCSYDAFQKLFPMLKTNNQVINRVMKKYVDSWVKSYTTKKLGIEKIVYVCENCDYDNADISGEIVSVLRKLRDNSNSIEDRVFFINLIESILEMTTISSKEQETILKKMNESLKPEDEEEHADELGDHKPITNIEENRLISRGVILDEYLRGYQPLISNAISGLDYEQAINSINELCSFVFSKLPELGVYEIDKRLWCGIPVVMQSLSRLCMVTNDEICLDNKEKILKQVSKNLKDTIKYAKTNQKPHLSIHVANTINNFLQPQSVSTWNTPYATVYKHIKSIDSLNAEIERARHLNSASSS